MARGPPHQAGGAAWCDAGFRQTDRVQLVPVEHTVLGQLDVSVQSGVQCANLPLIVVLGEGSSLLGRDWLLQLRLDWKEIHQLQSDDPAECVLCKHPEVFREGLGTLQGYKVKIYVDKEARPKFCKARIVLYSIRVKVDEELDRLVSEGILENAGLRLQRRKCFLMQQSITFLGHRIDAQGLHPLPEMVRAVQEAPRTKNAAELKSYLGLVSYYANFLPNLSSTVYPLYRLLCQATPWQWTSREQQAFQASKQLLTSAPYSSTSIQSWRLF